MKYSILTMAILSCSTVSMASNINYLNSGPAVTVGSVSNSELSSSGRFNPANNTLNTNKARFSLFDATFGVEMEGLGEFESVFDTMSDQIDDVQDTYDAYDEGSGDVSVGDVLSEVDDLEATLDSNIDSLSDSFYFQSSAFVSMPLTPAGIDLGKYGTISIGLSSLTSARASLLHDEISFDIDADTIIEASDDDEDLEATDYLDTTSSIYLKQAQIFNADISWSKVLPPMEFLESRGFEAVGGLRATLIGYNLQKNLYPLKDLVDQAEDDSDQLLDDIEDDISDGFSDYDFTLALDAGLTLQRENTLIGITVYNINSPTLDYNSLGGDCASITDTSDQDECFHAEYFAAIGDISLDESHTMHPSVTVDAAQSFYDNRVVIAGAIDLMPYHDPFGEESQNLNMALLLQPTAWYWPRWRFGFGKDLTDLDPTQLGMGLSLFKYLEIDAQMTAVLGDLFNGDSTEQGNAIRSASVSASINLEF